MVAADRTGHAGRHADDGKRVAVLERERIQADRNKDSEGTPGSSCRKCKTNRNHKYDCREEILQRLCASGYKIRNIRIRSERQCHRLQRPCENKDHDGRDHRLEAFCQAFHALFEFKDSSQPVNQDRDDQGQEGSEDKAYGSVTVRKCIDKSFSVEETAGVDHAEHAADDQGDDRKHQIDDRSVALHLIISVGRSRDCEKIAFGGIFLMLCHRAVIHFQDRDQDHHENGQQCVIIIGNRADEQKKAVRAFRSVACDGSCPGRDRCDDTDRRSRGIDEIRKLGAGYIVTVSDRTHD